MESFRVSLAILPDAGALRYYLAIAYEGLGRTLALPGWMCG